MAPDPIDALGVLATSFAARDPVVASGFLSFERPALTSGARAKLYELVHGKCTNAEWEAAGVIAATFRSLAQGDLGCPPLIASVHVHDRNAPDTGSLLKGLAVALKSYSSSNSKMLQVALATRDLCKGVEVLIRTGGLDHGTSENSSNSEPIPGLKTLGATLFRVAIDGSAGARSMRGTLNEAGEGQPHRVACFADLQTRRAAADLLVTFIQKDPTAAQTAPFSSLVCEPNSREANAADVLSRLRAALQDHPPDVLLSPRLLVLLWHEIQHPASTGLEEPLYHMLRDANIKEVTKSGQQISLKMNRLGHEVVVLQNCSFAWDCLRLEDVVATCTRHSILLSHADEVDAGVGTSSASLEVPWACVSEPKLFPRFLAFSVPTVAAVLLGPGTAPSRVSLGPNRHDAVLWFNPQEQAADAVLEQLENLVGRNCRKRAVEAAAQPRVAKELPPEKPIPQQRTPAPSRKPDSVTAVASRPRSRSRSKSPAREPLSAEAAAQAAQTACWAAAAAALPAKGISKAMLAVPRTPAKAAAKRGGGRSKVKTET